MAKTKKLFYFVTITLLLTPLVSSAQWIPERYVYSELPTGGGRGVYGIIENLMMWILAIFSFIGIIGFAISGIMYLTAAGSETQIEKAKTAMKWSIIGVIVGLVGLVIIFAVDNALNAVKGF